WADSWMEKRNGHKPLATFAESPPSKVAAIGGHLNLAKVFVNETCAKCSRFTLAFGSASSLWTTIAASFRWRVGRFDLADRCGPAGFVEARAIVLSRIGFCILCHWHCASGCRADRAAGVTKVRSRDVAQCGPQDQDDYQLKSIQMLHRRLGSLAL